MARFLAIPHRGKPELWYRTAETMPDYDAGDAQVLSDHDLYAIFDASSQVDLDYLKTYTGHQWLAVRSLANTLIPE